VALVDRHALVDDRHLLLRLHFEAALNKLKTQTGFVRRFKQSRTEFPMNLDRRADDCFGNSVQFLLFRLHCFLRDLCELCGSRCRIVALPNNSIRLTSKNARPVCATPPWRTRPTRVPTAPTKRAPRCR